MAVVIMILILKAKLLLTFLLPYVI